MADTFEVELQKVIFYGKEVWCPTQKIVEDRTFFSFTKWTPQLVYLLTGKRLKLASTRADQSGSLNVPIMQKIMDARQKACDDAYAEAVKVEDSADEGPGSKRKRKSAKEEYRKAFSKDLHLLPEVLEVSVGDFRLALLSEGLNTTTIWMELRPENLTWLKSCVESEEAKPRQKREAKKK